MKAFGLEIRKANSIAGLYGDVDRVLHKAGLLDQSVTRGVQIATCAHALQRMLKVERHFSVCTVRELSEMAQINIPRERMSVYSSIHCMNWNEMTEEYRQVIMAMVLDDFRGVLMDIEA